MSNYETARKTFIEKMTAASDARKEVEAYELHVAWSAMALANALADGEPEADMKWRLSSFIEDRAELASCRAKSGQAELEYEAASAALREERKTPPAVAPAEGFETPNG